MAFPWISLSPQDVGPRTKEPLSFPATPPSIVTKGDSLCPGLWAGPCDQMAEGLGEGGGGENHRIREDTSSLWRFWYTSRALRPQAYPPSGSHQQWGEEAGGLICI